MEMQLGNGLRLRATAYKAGIFRVQVGGHDGFAESLIDRYGFVEQLPEADSLTVGQHTLQLDPMGGFALVRDAAPLVASLPTTRLATAPTRFGNQGCRLEIALAEGEKLIGGGDHYRKGFLLNGRADELWIRYPVKHVPVPLFMSSRGYALFFNTTRRLRYDIGAAKPGIASFTIPKDALDVYLIPGRDYAAIIRSYTLLTGRPQLPPLKSFGLWLLMHSMANGHDILQVARMLRDDGIPCDNISLEPDWMEQRYDYTVNKEWNNERFRGAPNTTFRAGADRMIHALNRMGFELGLWLCSRWDFTHEEERRRQTTQAVAESALDLDGIEISHHDENVGHQPERMDTNTVRDQAWFEHLKKFVKDGVRFFKLDPALLINEFPDRLYGNGCTDDEMHNIAFMLASKQMCLDFEAFTQRRYYGISVAGWAGFQRYPGTWAGDTGGGNQSMVGILQDALVGHSFATCDMSTAGAAGLHMGFLLPWALINSWASFHYPGYQGETMDGMYRDYARLRMSLLPYLYSLAYEATQSGLAMARPLCLVYPEADAAYSLTNQYLLGESLLVTVYQDHVVLPAGRWFDCWNHTILTGDWQAQQPTIPANRGGHLLLREGGIVPTIEPMRHTGERPITTILWQLFPGPVATSFTLYLDDGDSLANRAGKYAAVTLTCAPTATGWELTWSPITGAEPERISGLTHQFEVVGILGGATANGRALTVTPDAPRNRAYTGPTKTGETVVFAE